MSDNNVVQFPKKGDEAPRTTAGQVAQMEELRRARQQLENVNKQRKSAIDSLDKRVKNLLDSEVIKVDYMSKESVETLREVRSALNSALLALEAHDRLIDMITHDLVGVVKNMEHQSVNAFQVTTHLQVLTDLMLQKGLMTEEEIEARFHEVMRPVQDKVNRIKAGEPLEEVNGAEV